MVRPYFAAFFASTLLVCATSAIAQVPETPPAPVPVPPPSLPYVPTPAVTPSVYLPTEAPAIVVAPGLGLHGFFVDLEANLAIPQITRFSGVPVAGLDVTVAPEFMLGYRFDYGGSILFAFRFLDATGSRDTTDDVLGPIHIRSKEENNVWDIDYASPVHDVGGNWFFQWQIGARFANLVTQSEITDTTGDYGLFKNSFDGAGAHLTLGFARGFGDTGLSLFTRIDGSILGGTGHQRFDVTSGGTFFPDGDSGSETAESVRAELGLNWVPPNLPWLHLAAGYLYEEWWIEATGKNHSSALYDRAGSLDHGPFIRCELSY